MLRASERPFATPPCAPVSLRFFLLLSLFCPVPSSLPVCMATAGRPEGACAGHSRRARHLWRWRGDGSAGAPGAPQLHRRGGAGCPALPEQGMPGAGLPEDHAVLQGRLRRLRPPPACFWRPPPGWLPAAPEAGHGCDTGTGSPSCLSMPCQCISSLTQRLYGGFLLQACVIIAPWASAWRHSSTGSAQYAAAPKFQLHATPSQHNVHPHLLFSASACMVHLTVAPTHAQALSLVPSTRHACLARS